MYIVHFKAFFHSSISIFRHMWSALETACTTDLLIQSGVQPPVTPAPSGFLPVFRLTPSARSPAPLKSVIRPPGLPPERPRVCLPTPRALPPDCPGLWIWIGAAQQIDFCLCPFYFVKVNILLSIPCLSAFGSTCHNTTRTDHDRLHQLSRETFVSLAAEVGVLNHNPSSFLLLYSGGRTDYTLIPWPAKF